MNNRIIVSPSILSADFVNLERDIKRVEDAGADWIHVDVMDGHFVPNITIGIPVVKAIKRIARVPLDVHLMIMEPEKYIKDYVDAGADIITFHESASKNTSKTLDLIHSFGKKAGLVLNPDVAVSTVIPYLDKVEVIMLMGVYPGFSGQKFIPEVLDKVVELKNLVKDRDILIELDGGVKANNIAQIVSKGVDICVGGSSVFNASSIEEGLKALLSAE